MDLEISPTSKLLIFFPITGGLGIIIMATYETFAAVYDAVMDDSLYDLWTDFSLRHLPKTKERKKLTWNWLVELVSSLCAFLKLALM